MPKAKAKPAAAGRKSARKPKRKPQHLPTTGRLHLDRRVEQIKAAPEAAGDDDDLLTTKQLAQWFGMSKQWFEIGRGKRYAPPFRKLGPTIVRYRRGDVRRWLDQRAFISTQDYPK